MIDSTTLSTKELAKRWGLKPQTLRDYRHKGTGPEYVTLDRKFLPVGEPYVLYPLASVLAFESAHSITPLT